LTEYFPFQDFNRKISHKEHKAREEQKENLKVFVRNLIVKPTHSLRTKTLIPSL